VNALIHVANVLVIKQELGGLFDLTLVRREVEHVPLSPMALILVSIYACECRQSCRTILNSRILIFASSSFLLLC
jgi:hypothetical protein